MSKKQIEEICEIEDCAKEAKYRVPVMTTCGQVLLSICDEHYKLINRPLTLTGIVSKK